MVWSGFIWLLVTDQWEALENDNLTLSSTKNLKDYLTCQGLQT